MTQSSLKEKKAKINLTLNKNRFFGSVLKSPAQMGSLSVKKNRMDTFKLTQIALKAFCGRLFNLKAQYSPSWVSKRTPMSNLPKLKCLH
jgi:hypothetical protein